MGPTPRGEQGRRRVQTHLRSVHSRPAKQRRSSYYENNIKGDYVIRLKGPYDIAVNKQKDGMFDLTCDWWDGHVENEVGKNYGKLLQLYGVHKAIREAKRKGHLVQRRQQENGSIKLIIAAA